MPEINENFIAGAWTSATDFVENRNPSDVSDLIGRYAQATEADLDKALAAAREAQIVWAAVGLEARSAALDAIGRELMNRSQELGRLVSREEGKPLAEGVGEVYRSGQFFTYFAAEVLRQIGDRADSVRPGVEIDVRREPVGTVAIVSPWNFPIATMSWKLAPALAFGNAAILKPANLTPGAAWALAEIISRQNLPRGLVNLLMGTGSGVGAALVRSPLVDAVSFTGSLDVGKQVLIAAAPNLTRVQLEMGSKNPLLVMEDAAIDVALAAAVAGAFGGTGQKCTASSRIIVHERIHDRFVEQFVARARAIKVGHALDPQIEMGPVVSEGQLRANLDYVALARSEGAELACGGGTLQRDTEGYFMAPTVFVNTRSRMRINQEEMFAPIACVVKVASFDEAVHVANDTDFGLTAGIVTTSLAYASEFRRRSQSGCVMVNLPTAGTDYHVPFGGVKASSYGPREQGQYAVEFYTHGKTSYTHAGAPR